MIWAEIIEISKIIDSPQIDRKAVQAAFPPQFQPEITSQNSDVDLVKITIPGTRGRIRGGDQPTLGIIGRSEGIGARPEVKGLISDSDGAIVALATALKISRMLEKGESIAGDLIFTTHLCPRAKIMEHYPVPFVISKLDMQKAIGFEVDPAMEAILSIDATKGNRILNQGGVAITPTLKEGYLLRVSEDLLDTLETITGKPPLVLPLTTQDITPYSNGLYHINSIMQPGTVTSSPVVGVAITSETAIPGCAAHSTNPSDLETAARFVLSTAQKFAQGRCSFYDPEEFKLIQKLYGPLKHLTRKETNIQGSTSN